MGKKSGSSKNKRGSLPLLLMLLVLALVVGVACLVFLVRGFVHSDIPTVGVALTGLAICGAVLRVLSHEEKKLRKP